MENEASENLKDILCKVTSLATPIFELLFQVHADASNFALGGFLMQKDSKSILNP